MMRTLKVLAVLSLAVGLGWFLFPADAQPDKDFKADDAIETIEVKLHIGEGDDLEEALALDLGLGFPLWLHPVGRKAEESAPFGAVPQETTAKAKVDAKSSVTFTFNLKADDGQDAFRMTPHLLAGLRVSDIARVGFASQGSNNWLLAGYEIKINGKVFSAGKPKADQEWKAKAAQDAAQKKLADLALTIAPLETAWADLVELVKTELATDADKKEVEDVATKLIPLVAAKRRLEGQVAGQYPWFVDKDFTSPWRNQETIKSVEITLTTATHTGADTQNYVYLHTGGRKYLLGSPATPLTGTTEPQTFKLDLEAGPLTAADLRGWGVGMLAHSTPHRKAPDRWHPQRFHVEVDGKPAYDSEDNELDRKSLDAIRLIPPVHKDQDGQLVKNTPVSRETFVWFAGRKLGLDADTGAPLPLPDPKDETSPKSETTPESKEVPDPTDLESKVEPKDPKDDVKEPEPPADPDKAPLLPGEQPVDPIPETPSTIDSDPSDSTCTSGGKGKLGNLLKIIGGLLPPGSGGDTLKGIGDLLSGPSDPGATPESSGSTSIGGADGSKAPADLTKVPTPVGSTFQVHHVRIVGGIWKADQSFKVVWQVTGDETAIDKYVVSLQPVQPHLEDPYSAPGIFLAEMPRGSRSAIGPLGPLPAGVDPRSLFLRPVVTAIPVDTSLTPNAGTGAARASFPVGSTIVGQPILKSPFVWWHLPAPPAGIHLQPISWSGPTPALKKAVWPVNKVVRSDNDVLFDSTWPGRHLGVRLEEGDSVRIEMRIPKAAFAASERHLIAHVGFLGGPGASNGVKTQMIFSWRTSTDAPVAGAPATLLVEAAAGDVMKLIDQKIDAPPATADHLRVRVYVSGGPFDLAHPPALFGVRLVP